MNLENSHIIDQKEKLQILNKELAELVNAGTWKIYLNGTVHFLHYMYRYFSTNTKLKGIDTTTSGPILRYLNVPMKAFAFFHDGLENRKMTRWIDETFK